MARMTRQQATDYTLRLAELSTLRVQAHVACRIIGNYSLHSAAL